MKTTRGHEVPESLRPLLKKAVILEWVAVAYFVSAAALLAVVMGNSQAMRTEFVEAALDALPPIFFLISSRVRRKEPDEQHRYGYHRSVTVAFLAASLSLLGVGGYLLVDASLKLAHAEHPTIGTVDLFGSLVWHGWVMIAALIYTLIPPVVIGILKMKPARALHDKTLYAQADMNKAAWLSSLAAILGVLGIGIGWWWADAAAAVLISGDVIYDGITNTRNAVADILDRKPRTADQKAEEELPRRMRELLLSLDWVREADVRMRDNGHVFFAEAFVVPSGDSALTAKIDKALDALYALDWRVNDVVIEPVPTLERQDHPEPEPPGPS